MNPSAVVKLSVVSSLVGAVLACSQIVEPFCPNGVAPFDGESGVALDRVIVFRTGHAVPDDVPDLSPAVFLRQGRREVPVDLEVKPNLGIIRMIPREPLSPNTVYTVGGVDWFGMDSQSMHWRGQSDFGNDYAETQFTTGSAPALLETFVLEDEVQTIVLAFSEPVDLDTVADRILLVEGERSRALDLIGTFDSQPHLVWMLPSVHVDGALHALGLLPGILGDSGVEVALPEEVPTLQTSNSEDIEQRLASYEGEPFCFLSTGVL